MSCAARSGEHCWRTSQRLAAGSRRYSCTAATTMGPLIGVAIDAAIRREQATMAPGNAPDTAGVILLSGDRRPTVSTPAGEYWLRRLRDADRDGHAPLPIAVWAAVAGLRSGGTSARSLTVATPDGDVRIEASLAEADGAVAIVVVPVRPPNPPTIPDSWGLTSRERAVVQLVLRGLGNREIAEGLFISENTVEFHLRHIYEKLAIRGRSQLLARFFRETFWPHLAAPVDGGRRLDTGDR
jgi:DNA-binding CsgD family transcriptional regulator